MRSPFLNEVKNSLLKVAIYFRLGLCVIVGYTFRLIIRCRVNNGLFRSLHFILIVTHSPPPVRVKSLTQSKHNKITNLIERSIFSNHWGFARPIIPQAILAPAWPVVFESEKPPVPRSSSPACNRQDLPMTEYSPTSFTIISVVSMDALPLLST